jgi:predicted MPP superfamily phosphohydrolase
MPIPRWARVAGVLAAVLGAYAGLHAYVAQRMIVAPGWPGAAQALGVGALLLLGLGVPLRLAGRRFAQGWLRWLATPAYVWLGFGFLLLVSLAVSDLLWAAGGALARAGGEGAAPGAEALRARDGARTQALLAGVAAFGAGVFGLWRARQGPRIARVEIRLARWPAALDGLRIAQISDVHIGSQLRAAFAAEVVARANALAPDLIAITGDLVDGSLDSLAAEVAPFAELRAPHGVFFVTGNHDHYSGDLLWAAHLEQLGMRVLRNRHVTLEHGGARFVLAGVDDHRGGLRGSSEDLPRALEGRDARLAVVLLAHDPNSFAQASRLGVDLQLSGHTHGGQIWPFHYLVRLVTPWVAGLHAQGPAQLYVSRGTGFWGPPMRLGAPAEITEITLRSAPERPLPRRSCRGAA